MNRFKKTMALTAACVIAATAVNVGGVGVNDAPKVTLGNIVAAAAPIAISGAVQQGGMEKTKDTESVQLTFASDPGAITREHITIEGAELSSAENAISGEGVTRTFVISNIAVADSANITITIKPVGENTFAPKEVKVYKALPSTEVVANSASVENNAKTKVVLVFEKGAITDVPANSKDGFKIDGLKEAATINAVNKVNDNIELTLNRALKANEEFTVSYDPTALTHDKRVKAGENIFAGKFSVKVTNNVQPSEANVYKVDKVEVLDGVKDVQTSSKIKITFEKALPGLTKEDFALSAASVEKAETKDDGKSYILDITDISSAAQMVSCKKIDYGFTGDARSFKVFVKTTSSDGGSSQSSVRPDSSSPSKTEEVKKEEPKKEEPKKEEAKKDEMANAPKSAEKVSTKLVIGQKTYTAMVNGQAVEKTMDVAPMVHQGRTVLPARMISELLGVDVKFDQKSKTASFMYGEGNKVELTLGQKFMMVNGEKVALTADILNKDGRILLPVTDIQKAFAKLGLEATVSWDAATKSVTIEK